MVMIYTDLYYVTIQLSNNISWKSWYPQLLHQVGPEFPPSDSKFCNFFLLSKLAPACAGPHAEVLGELFSGAYWLPGNLDFNPFSGFTSPCFFGKKMKTNDVFSGVSPLKNWKKKHEVCPICWLMYWWLFMTVSRRGTQPETLMGIVSDLDVHQTWQLATHPDMGEQKALFYR